MNNKKPVVMMIILLALFLWLHACGGGGAGSPGSASSSVSKPAEPPAKVLYLRSNIHTQAQDAKTYRANYENWTNPGAGHTVFPVNTIVEIDYGRFGFYVVDKKTGRKIDFEYNDGGMGGMKMEEYVNKILTATESVSLKNLSEIDRKGITEGKGYTGMSKEGVRIALGYPAVNRTPSLSSNAWVYARSRFTSTTVTFDEKGRVKGIR